MLDEVYLKKHFIDWVKNNYKHDFFKNDEYSVFNIYTKANTEFHNELPIEFQTLAIEYNIPDIIMTENNNYYVGISAYDEKIEYLTLRFKN